MAVMIHMAVAQMHGHTHTALWLWGAFRKLPVHHAAALLTGVYNAGWQVLRVQGSMHKTYVAAAESAKGLSPATKPLVPIPAPTCCRCCSTLRPG
jgi:hypothetical protein